MVKTTLRIVLVSMLMTVAAPAYAVEVTQMWKCEMDDDASEDDVIAAARDWLNAAKRMEGGEGLEAYVYFPLAVNGTGETDLLFVVVAPSFEEWGRFWDGYKGSEAAALEARNREAVVCPDSVIWESLKVEGE